MPFWMIRQDVTRMDADAVVNAANTALQMGGGVCGAIFRAAGEEAMRAACDPLAPIRPGEAVITPGFGLRARHVIHTAGPVWRGGGEGEEETLRACYLSSLALAKEHGLQSVAFPLISSGVYGYPPDEALRVASEAIREFLQEHDMEVTLALFGGDAVAAGREAAGDIQQYIDDNYAFAAERTEGERRRRMIHEHRMRRRPQGPDAFPPEDAILNYNQDVYEARLSRPDFHLLETLLPDEAPAPRKRTKPSEALEYTEQYSLPSIEPKPFFPDALEGMDTAAPAAPARRKKEPPAAAPLRPSPVAPARAKPALPGLETVLDRPFSALLLELIDRKGLTDPEVYRRANIDRRLFSKLRREGYMPSKRTALALCVALELNEDETQGLLRAAGYALSRSILSDVIVRYFIQRGIFDIFIINAELFSRDQQLLGGCA
ncbi:MAG TPA: macro domain-containing protein [Candidatus Limnocylindria bacterium]|nr:macro domain-containing protein [Candidatus Limnocylindria bacterium]